MSKWWTLQRKKIEKNWLSDYCEKFAHICTTEPEKIIQEDNLATLLLQFSDQEDGQNLVKIVKLLKISGVQSKLLSNDASLFQYLSKGTDWTFHKVTLQTFSCFFGLTCDFEVLNSKIGWQIWFSK